MFERQKSINIPENFAEITSSTIINYHTLVAEFNTFTIELEQLTTEYLTKDQINSELIAEIVFKDLFPLGNLEIEEIPRFKLVQKSRAEGAFETDPNQETEKVFYSKHQIIQKVEDDIRNMRVNFSNAKQRSVCTKRIYEVLCKILDLPISSKLFPLKYKNVNHINDLFKRFLLKNDIDSKYYTYFERKFDENENWENFSNPILLTPIIKQFVKFVLADLYSDNLIKNPELEKKIKLTNKYLAQKIKPFPDKKTILSKGKSVALNILPFFGVVAAISVFIPVTFVIIKALDPTIFNQQTSPEERVRYLLIEQQKNNVKEKTTKFLTKILLEYGLNDTNYWFEVVGANASSGEISVKVRIKNPILAKTKPENPNGQYLGDRLKESGFKIITDGKTGFSFLIKTFDLQANPGFLISSNISHLI